MNPSILFQVLPTASRKKVAIATLNRPQVLNGLSLEMCELLSAQLMQWECDSSIALVILKGTGERAFCAGGDLRSLYKTMQENYSGRPWDNTYARSFFATEYRLDYCIHTYSKPILCWANAIVMGGGVGLMMGASHRVVTDTTRLAMPEISIGLFPDVGGTWMLSRLPGGVGLFLGLTGAQLGASDCRFLGLADYYLEAGQWPALIQEIQARSWSDVKADNNIRLHRALRALLPHKVLPLGPLQANYSVINEMFDGPDFDAICAEALDLAQSTADDWLTQAVKTFSVGSPGSARLCFTLLRKARHLSLADAFRLEYIAALQCTVMGDFQEGVRALLIDKDKDPKWNPQTLASASDHWVQRFFEQPWGSEIPHPLIDLGYDQDGSTNH